MGVFHLLHHEHQARYDKMFPYLWVYTVLLLLISSARASMEGNFRSPRRRL